MKAFAVREPPPLRLPGPGFALFLPLLVVWGTCAFALWSMWGFGIERSYGFSVFPLAGYLCFGRYSDSRLEVLRSPDTGRWVLVALAGATLLGAASLVLVAAPLWTALGWLAGIGAISASLGLLGSLGGSAWVKAGLFPFGFTLTALPWPSLFQAPLLQNLRQVTAAWSANLVSWTGHPAIAHGNVIETASGWVGVDEACSGMVGLQTAIMLGLFFGELRKLSTGRRVVLVISAAAIALAANLIRTTYLTWTAALSGVDALRAAHDAAGGAEVGGAILGVVLLSYFFRGLPVSPSPAPLWNSKIFPWCSLAVVLTLLSFAIGTSLWYRQGPSDGPSAEISWTLVAPSPEWRAVSLAPGTQAMLRFDTALNLTWRDREAGRDWIALHLTWDSDSALRYLPLMHSPEICLPHTGATLDAILGNRSVVIDQVVLEMRCARFRAAGKSFYTFSCLWDAHRGRPLDPAANASVGMTAGRWAMIRERRRHLGLEQLTLVLNQCRDDQEAFALWQTMAPRLFHVRR